MALTQCMAVATMPGLRARPASIVSGCSFLNVVRQLGSPVTSTSKRSPSGPNAQAGSRCSSPMSQLTAAVITGSPSTRPSHRKRCAATVPGSIGPMGESIGAVATAISWVVRSSGSRSKPSSSATMHTDWRNPAPRASAMMLVARLLGRLAEQHPVADDVGCAVGADVGELLGPDVGDRPRQRRDHEREPLGDAAGVDAGAVQGDAGLAANASNRAALVGGRVEPAERRDHVLARLEDGGHHAGVGHERAVDDAVGVEGEQRVDVAGGA